MPLGHGYTKKKKWEEAFRDHINVLRGCMATKGENSKCYAPTDPTKQGIKCTMDKECGVMGICTPKECKTIPPKNNGVGGTAPSDPGAHIRASLDGGNTWPLDYYVSNPPNNGLPYLISPGTGPILIAWEADPSFTSCDIEATFPPGVVAWIPGSFFQPITTASNWGLPDSPVEVAPLYISGDYRFDLYCNEGIDLAASLTFEISGPPPTLLQIQAIVNDIGSDTAEAGTYYTNSPTSVSVNTQPGDEIAIFWSAGNAVACSLYGPDVSSDRATGYEPIILASNGPQIYSLSCADASGKSYNVSVTVNPTP
jgi:hypothetical protein